MGDPGGDSKPCPRCGETIRAVAVLCRFCRADLVEPAAAPLPPPRRSGWPLVLACLAAGFAGPLLVGGILAVMVFSLEDDEGRTACRERLASLHLWLRHAEESADGLPPGSGSSLLRALAWQSEHDDLPDCPGGGFVSPGPYRGPIKAWDQLEEEDPVACCPPNAHAGGFFILLKNGRIRFVRPGDALHASAASQTAD